AVSLFMHLEILFLGLNLTGQLPTVDQQPSPVAHGFQLPPFSVRLFSTIHFSSCRRSWACRAFTDTTPSFFAWSTSSSTNRSLFMDLGSDSNLEKAVPLVLANLSLRQAPGCARLRPRVTLG